MSLPRFSWDTGYTIYLDGFTLSLKNENVKYLKSFFINGKLRV